MDTLSASILLTFSNCVSVGVSDAVGCLKDMFEKRGRIERKKFGYQDKKPKSSDEYVC